MSAVVVETRVSGRLNGSVGLGGFNNPEDVGAVQQILKNKGYYGQSRVDKVCGPFTIQAIKAFQAKYVMRNPDGLIQPGRGTWRKLIDPALCLARTGRPARTTTTRLAPAVAPLAANKLSEKGHWFIFHIEAGSGQGATKSLHWPEGASGVTIGPGYDMKEREASAIKSDLMHIGLSASVAESFSGGAGLTGQGALQFCNQNKHLANLTKEQQLGLLKLIAPRYERIVKKWIKVNLQQNEYDALVCFVYNPMKSFVPVATMINNGETDKAMTEIMSRVPASGVNRKGLIARRTKEVTLFVDGVYADVTEA